MEEALGRLPEQPRLALTLHYINGYTTHEIAGFLGTSPGAVRTRLHRGHEQLREEVLAMVKRHFEDHSLPEGSTEEVVQRVRRVEVTIQQRPDGDQHIIHLEDEQGRVLPIWVEEAAARNAQAHLKGPKLSRPMTHDLLVSALSEFGISVERIDVCDLRDATFYASMVLSRGKTRKAIDLRPSDAINIALRTDAPMFVAEKVMEQAYMKRKDGKPMTLSGTLRRVRARKAKPKETWQVSGPCRQEGDAVVLTDRKRGDIHVAITGLRLPSDAELQMRGLARPAGPNERLPVLFQVQMVAHTAEAESQQEKPSPPAKQRRRRKS